MSLFKNIFGTDDEIRDDVRDETTEDSAKLRLRKEELDINKIKAQKGEVELGKEIIEERKTVDVPVLREEVVIERKSFDNEESDSPITDEETIKIPVSEERVDVDKHTVVTGEISAHKHAIEDTAHIDETLKREEARVNRIGNPDVVDNSIDNE